MPARDLESLDTRLRDAIAKVCAWWGPTFSGDYTINVKNNRGPSMAMIPAWRGNPGTMLLRTERTRRGRSPITHELVHIFAPNANRFLAEGLATYGHEYLGGQTAYPTFGEDLHVAAKRIASEVDLETLDAIVTPKGLRIDDRKQQRKAYTAAGSFVRFLIEEKGMDSFRTLYALTPMVPGERIPSDPDRWQGVYGAPLKTLEREWREFLEKQD